METLGERVKRLRLAVRMSQRALGAKAGTSGSYISQLEADDMPRPGNNKLAGIARTLGVSIEELAGGVGEGQDEELRAVRRVLQYAPREKWGEVERFVREWLLSPVDDQRLVWDFQRALSRHRRDFSGRRRVNVQPSTIHEEAEEYEAKEEA